MVNGTIVEMEMEATDTSIFGFKVEAANIDLTGTANPMAVGLSVDDGRVCPSLAEPHMVNPDLETDSELARRYSARP